MTPPIGVWRRPGVPWGGKASGGRFETAGAGGEALVAQIARAVRWVDCVQTLSASGVTETLEVGPGRTLTGLVRQIDRDVEAASADSPKKLESFVAKRAG